MKRFLSLLALCLAVIIVIVLNKQTQAQRAPLVLAFYYNWFDENTWTPAKVPDMPATRYVSRDPAAIARQIDQARNAGIDAFVVSWWGAGNPTEDNFKLMLAQANSANFRAAIDFELTSPFYGSKADVIKSLRNLLATHAQHPAYLRSEGKPVIFFWREQKYSVDEWRDIRNQVDPNRSSLWIAEGVKEQLPYLSVFDGFHLYSIAWSGNVAAELQKWPPRIQTYGANKIWVATTMPGNDDTRTKRPDSYVRDRRNGEFYRETWRAAFSTYPDWIIITSWNEWVEGTMIEPSVTYGNLYLDITRSFASQFKAGLPEPTAVPTATPKPTTAATPTPTVSPTVTPTRFKVATGSRATISDTVRVRASSSTSSEILGYLSEGTVVTLLTQSANGVWFQIPYPTGDLRGWVHSDYIDLNTVPILNVTPSPMPTATITPTPTETPLVDTPTPTDTPTPIEIFKPTVTPTSTPTSGFTLPSLKSILPFLP
ncbi:MAG: glycoside hydrolase family 99-like domain-containing protein [Chloroflexi bacterium]|nr:glycoside hydrolase family 99-like domain-containing protein [Chloroflexota bacterium]